MRAMSFPPVSFGAISVDARDPGAVAAFWVDLIGGRIAGQNDEAAIVVAPGYPVIEFFKVEEAKAAKNRVHIDVLAADLETATSRAVALGAVEVTEGPLAGPFRWKVLTDPEGNEFCICPLTPDGAPPSHPAFRVMAAARGFSAALGAEPDDALRRRPAPDEWSAIEVAGHVVDKLRTWTQRIARTVSEERPAIVPYDQDALVLALDHQHADVDFLIDELNAAFDRFIRLVGSLDEAEAAREMDHPEYGPLSIDNAVELVLGSVEDHLDQLHAAART